MKILSASWQTRAAAERERRRRRASSDGQVNPDLARWRADPFLWAKERLGVRMDRWAQYAPKLYVTHAWDGTTEPLWSAGQALARNQSVAVSSAIGIGKTFFGGILTLWFADCWPSTKVELEDGSTIDGPGGQVVTFAPKRDQLRLHIWKEIGSLWPRFQRLHPRAQLDTLRIQMRTGRDDWGAVGFVCGVGADEEVANRARGFHAEHLLLIFEETTGIDRAILDAASLTCVAPHNLRLYFGNPDSLQDTLAQVSKEPGVVAIRASALDHPNLVANNPSLIPGAQSRQRIEEQKAKYGVEDPLYQSRVRGLAPAQGQSALIRLEWLEAAAQRAKDPRTRRLLEVGETALGVDVANSEDGDKASITEGKGRMSRKTESFRCPDANVFGRLNVYPYIKSRLVKPERVGVDNVGVGVGTVNELRRLGAEVQGLNGGSAMWEQYAEDEKFANLRSQMWWQARVDLQEQDEAKAVGMEHDQELFEDLICPKWRTHNGKIIVESKEDLVARLGRSPDKGDSWVYWNWIRQASNQPVARQLRVRWG